MASTTRRLPLATIGGVLAILLFCVFTFTSAVRYPGPFSPVDNWLSDLGTATKNPAGDVYFNVGCILTGVSLLLMMAGMSAWRSGDPRKDRALMAGQACGGASAFALMLIGVFVEGTAYHGILAMMFFLLLFLFLVLANVAVWKHPAYRRWIGYYALVAIVIDLVFIYTFFAYDHAPAWEWLAVFSALLWVGLLAGNALELEAPSA